MSSMRPLKVFLCHTSADKSAVYWLNRYLVDFEVDAWLDIEKLLPGQDWKEEIPKAIENSDAVIVCMSKDSVDKKGYVQREIRFALDVAQELPLHRSIFLIPARLDNYDVLPKLPDELKKRHYVNLFEEDGLKKLLRSLQTLAQEIDPDSIAIPSGNSVTEKSKQLAAIIARENNWKSPRNQTDLDSKKVAIEPITSPIPQRIKPQGEERPLIWGIGMFFIALFALLALGTSLIAISNSLSPALAREKSTSGLPTDTPISTLTVSSTLTETPVTPTYTPTLQEISTQTPALPITQVFPITQIVAITQVVPPTPTREVRTINFTVVSTQQDWQNTGIRLNTGDSVSIRYVSGLWAWTKEYPHFDAQGDPDSKNTCYYISTLIAPGAFQATCPIPSAQIDALIGKIGSNTPFVIGNEYNFNIPNSLGGETLYLTNNVDLFYGRGYNDGQIVVSISVSH